MRMIAPVVHVALFLVLFAFMTTALTDAVGSFGGSTHFDSDVSEGIEVLTNLGDHVDA